METDLSIEEVFESAVSIVRNLPKEGTIKPSDELKLKLYALYKQATHGPNDTPKPRFYQIVELYKWDAWRKLGNMTKEDAMSSYIGELKQIMQTIPEEEANIEDSTQFEDILGKKFYDYWFSQWKKSADNEKLDYQIIDRLGSASETYSNHQINTANGTRVSPSERRETISTNNSPEPVTRSMRVTVVDEDRFSDFEEQFLDTKTIDSQTGSVTDDDLVIFGLDGTPRNSVAKTATDQFAVALLRLQSSLEATNRRLSLIETRLDEHSKRVGSLGVSQSATSYKRARILSNRLYMLAYLGWPILVYITMRAIERRALPKPRTR